MRLSTALAEMPDRGADDCAIRNNLRHRLRASSTALPVQEGAKPCVGEPMMRTDSQTPASLAFLLGLALGAVVPLSLLAFGA